jgi:hypothetical protein
MFDWVILAGVIVIASAIHFFERDSASLKAIVRQPIKRIRDGRIDGSPRV